MKSPRSLATLTLAVAAAFVAGTRFSTPVQAPYETSPTLSDERFKTNVEPITDVLPRLERIRPVSFDWNEKHASLGVYTDRREIGVIAQNVQEVFPELVSEWGGEEGFLAVNYVSFAPILIEAVHELKAEIAALESRLAALEAAAAVETAE